MTSDACSRRRHERRTDAECRMTTADDLPAAPRAMPGTMSDGADLLATWRSAPVARVASASSTLMGTRASACHASGLIAEAAAPCRAASSWRVRSPCCWRHVVARATHSPVRTRRIGSRGRSAPARRRPPRTPASRRDTPRLTPGRGAVAPRIRHDGVIGATATDMRASSPSQTPQRSSAGRGARGWSRLLRPFPLHWQRRPDLGADRGVTTP